MSSDVDARFSLSSVALAPINYFSLEVDCYQVLDGNLQDKHRLPYTSILCDEETFADLYLGWSREGIYAKAIVRKPVTESCFPSPEEGDSVELFIDTRDRKSGGFNTRFCHHFCFLPEAVEGLMGREITRFRTEDAHELCNPIDLVVSVDLKKNSYIMHIFIPAHCLVGYDPDQMKRMGFTYRINRPNQSSQHFSLLSTEYQIDQQPSLWSTLKLEP